MRVRVLAAAALLLPALHGLAFGQTLDARRTAMGGVILPGGGPGGDAANVAYRAVPPAPHSRGEIPLPIGLVQLLADPPVLDADDPEFNVYDLVNTVYNPPWNLQLVKPEAPSNDIVLTLGRDHLGIELGEIASLFPDEESHLGGVARMPSLGFGVRRFFVGVSALGHFENSLRLNEALHGALAQGEPFTTNTDYTLWDDAQGQAAASLQLGWAGALTHSENPRAQDGSGLFVGARAKVLRGLAYGDARNQVSFATGDTLFASNPVDLDYLGQFRTAGPDGGGWGQGFDLGAVWLLKGFEVGVGVNDIATRIPWKVEESVSMRDSVSGDVVNTTIAEDVSYTSEIPTSVTVNAARRFGNTMIAADLVKGIDDVTYHLGIEHWLTRLALRAGAGLDTQRDVQYAGGIGLKLGRFGIDAAVASHSRNLSRERGLELGLGLAFYR